jgi:hypothetical protein
MKRIKRRSGGNDGDCTYNLHLVAAVVVVVVFVVIAAASVVAVVPAAVAALHSLLIKLTEVL